MIQQDEIQGEQDFLDFLDEVFARLPSEQADFICSQTQDRPEWRKRALNIIRDHSHFGGDDETVDALSALNTVAMPERIGAYEIESVLGSGAMGIVYLGVQKGDGFEQRAAVKLVPDIAISQRRLERLKVERGVLSELRHPNIAHMYDGGETATGAPFLAMEFVDGAPLDLYLRNQDPDWPTRLKIFEDICSAIKYAHKNLVVHRDLSPKNIMVNTEGLVKVIDFGIAQIIGATTSSEAQRYVYRNAGYSPPEDSNDTTSDIFSLGAILRLLRDGQSIARASDLDAIINQAMNVTPSARYETVQALLDDIHAYMLGKSVSAAAGGAFYKLSRFVQRKPVTMLAVGSAIIATIGAAVLFSFLYLRTLEAERITQARYDDVRDLTGFLIFDVSEELLQTSGSTELRKRLVERAVTYFDGMRLDDSGSDQLKLEAAIGYASLADILGVAGGSNLGDRNQAQSYISQAEELVEELQRTAPQLEGLKSGALKTEVIRGEFSRWSKNERATAATIFQHAEDIFQAIPNPTFEDRYFAARVQEGLAKASTPDGDLDLARTAAQTSVDRYLALHDEQPENATVLHGLARAYNSLHKSMTWKAYYQAKDGLIETEDRLPVYKDAIKETIKAETKLRQFLEQGKAGFQTKLMLGVTLLYKTNTSCYIIGEESQALADLGEVNDIIAPLAQQDPQNMYVREVLANAKLQEADCHLQIESFEDAIAAGRDAVAWQRQISNLEPDNAANIYRLISASSTLRWILEGAGEVEEACTVAQDTLLEWERYERASTEPLTERNKIFRADNHTALERCE